MSGNGWSEKNHFIKFYNYVMARVSGFNKTADPVKNAGSEKLKGLRYTGSMSGSRYLARDVCTGETAVKLGKRNLSHTVTCLQEEETICNNEQFGRLCKSEISLDSNILDCKFAMEYVKDFEFQKLIDDIDSYWDDGIGHLLTFDQMQMFFSSLYSKEYTIDQMREIWNNLKHFIAFVQSSPEKRSIEEFRPWEFSSMIFESIPRRYIGPKLSNFEIRNIFESVKLLYGYFNSEKWITSTDAIDEAISLIFGDEKLVLLTPEKAEENHVAFCLSGTDGNLNLMYRDLWILLIWAKEFDGEWSELFISLSKGKNEGRNINDAPQKLFRAKWLRNELKKNNLVPELFFYKISFGMLHIKSAIDWFYSKEY